MGTNIDASAEAIPAWDPADPAKALQLLAEYAQKQAKAAIDWYYHRKRRKAWLSTWTRLATILLTALGAIIPILSTLVFEDATDLMARLQMNHWGYLAVALAGVALGLDRYYGGSTGWMRYISTAMALETLLQEFRFDWVKLAAARGTSVDGPAVVAALDRLKALSLAVRGQVERETQAWVAEFQSNMAQLEKQAQEGLEAAREQYRKDLEAQATARQAAVDAVRPGAIEVEVGGGPWPDGFTVELDGKVRRQGVTGRTCGLIDVAPGLHELTVSATHNDGKRHVTSVVVSVTGGSVTKAKLESV